MKIPKAIPPLDPAAKVATVAQAQRILGISHDTVYRLIASGGLKSLTIGRKRLVTVASIEALLAQAEAA